MRRLSDGESTVRRHAIHKLCDAAAGKLENVTIEVMMGLRARAGDKKPEIRKEVSCMCRCVAEPPTPFVLSASRPLPNAAPSNHWQVLTGLGACFKKHISSIYLTPPAGGVGDDADEGEAGGDDADGGEGRRKAADKTGMQMTTKSNASAISLAFSLPPELRAKLGWVPSIVLVQHAAKINDIDLRTRALTVFEDVIIPKDASPSMRARALLAIMPLLNRDGLGALRTLLQRRARIQEALAALIAARACYRDRERVERERANTGADQIGKAMGQSSSAANEPKETRGTKRGGEQAELAGARGAQDERSSTADTVADRSSDDPNPDPAQRLRLSCGWLAHLVETPDRSIAMPSRLAEVPDEKARTSQACPHTTII